MLDVVYLLNHHGSSEVGLGVVLAELGLGADVASCTRVDHRTDRLVGAAVTLLIRISVAPRASMPCVNSTRRWRHTARAACPWAARSPGRN